MWTVLIPLKRLEGAKSRLRGAMPEISHEHLVRELAQSTIRAAEASQAVKEVVIVRGEGLNESLRRAAERIEGPIAAIPADLPALRSEELTEALTSCIPGRSFVPDAEGTGTVLLAAPAGGLDPHFGPGSAEKHEQSGARRIDGDWPTLRRDVDTKEHLSAVARLGYTLGPMQGTISSYDADTRSGQLLLDDGTPMSFDRAAFDASGLRLVRLGQRVSVKQGERGEIIRINIPTLS